MNMEVNANSKSVENMDINELRKTFASMGGKATRDWTAEDFRVAISNRQKNGNMVNVVMDDNVPPRPGYSRIRLHNNSNTENYPVPVLVNRYMVKIPRDWPVDVPHEVVSTLRNSYNPNWRSTVTRNAEGEAVAQRSIQNEPAYPFDLIAATAGVAKGTDGKPLCKGVVKEDEYRLREKFKEMWGRWPKRAEEKRFKEEQMKARVGKMDFSDDALIKQLAEESVANERK